MIFKPIGTPIQSDDEADFRQPKLITVGVNKTSLSQFHIKIDNHCISLKAKNTIEAVDYLFKAHYVFNVEFDSDLKIFWIFLQNYFCSIHSKFTNQMVDIYTKLEASKQQEIVEGQPT
ncbi:hypothetical protein KQX54_016093 [Cotesia glomerata]|uniref:Uncharacterized protein n=1 Tax=Cotesia glomerata TaxID=32391 RepID=A0AAV7IZL8_COTGL|nr:hypothetical protein KQX54_016093 [Cotesia glomerata]